MDEGTDLSAWVGRREERIDRVDPNRLAAWHATLDRDEPFPPAGAPVAPGFHWALFPPLARQSELGRDGHQKRGGFLPPVALPRRMWAGGRLAFHAPLFVGEEVRRISVIERVQEKQGKSGRLVFVLVRHRLSGAAGLAIEEEHDIVYREAPVPGAEAPAADAGGEPAPRGEWRREIVPYDVLLFRYSALAFNGHRIHYDRRYATAEEGYPGLVVHGPLIATLLLDLLRRRVPEAEIARFAFRSLRPTFDTGPFAVDGTPGGEPGHYRLWSIDNGGATAMEADAWVR